MYAGTKLYFLGEQAIVVEYTHPHNKQSFRYYKRTVKRRHESTIGIMKNICSATCFPWTCEYYTLQAIRTHCDIYS